ncbi:MAG: T9SS type A sorting domain-containing protein [Cryomorphaceae bacterium]|jgi:hypothetical protein|nr:T9SS type A sorting domain-containing protein [Cryomorphaceae bacterium]
MKKVYFSILFFGCSVAAFAQYAPKTAKMSSIINAPSKDVAGGEKAPGTVIWSDDFSNAATWTIDNSTQTDAAQWGWDIGTTEQSWYFNSGIASTSGGAYAELKNGNYNTSTQAINVTYTLTTAAPIDVQTLGGTDQVTLSFQQRGAIFNDDQQVQISTDGVTFTTVYTNNDREIFVGNNNSALYANPENVTVNLATFLAGNAGSVWIRFTWTSRFPSNSDVIAWTTFGWFIDDVAITTNPDFDADVTNTYWGTNGLTYYKIPLTQVAPIDFGADVLNSGTQTLNNVTLNVDINGTIGTSAPVSIPSLDTLSLLMTVPFTPSSATPTTYTATQTITSTETDDVPANNAIANVSFSTTSFIYARDNDVPTGTTYANGTTGFETGNLFEIFADQTVTAIDVRLTGGNGGTPVGTEVYARLYGIDSNGDFVYLSESNPLIVATTDLNTNVVMDLVPPVDLITGDAVLAVIGSYDPALVVTNAGVTEPQTSFFLDGNDMVVNTLYYQTNVPWVRLNFDPSVGMNETSSEISLASVYPNPANSVSTVNFTLPVSSNVKVTVTDVTGKVIAVLMDESNVSGEQKITFDASSYANGAYQVTIATDTSSITRKFMKR